MDVKLPLSHPFSSKSDVGVLSQNAAIIFLWQALDQNASMYSAFTQDLSLFGNINGIQNLCTIITPYPTYSFPLSYIQSMTSDYLALVSR